MAYKYGKRYAQYYTPHEYWSIKDVYKVYKLLWLTDDGCFVYYGVASTTMSQRLTNHRTSLKPSKKRRLCITAKYYKLYGEPYSSIVEVFDDKVQALKLEYKLITENECINKLKGVGHCSHCGVFRTPDNTPTTSFNMLHNLCYVCSNAKSRKWRANNKEHCRAKDKEYRQTKKLKRLERHKVVMS